MAKTPYYDFSDKISKLQKDESKILSAVSKSAPKTVKTGIDITKKALTPLSNNYNVTSSITQQIKSLENQLTPPETPYGFAEDSSEQKYLDYVKVLGDNAKIDKEIDVLTDELKDVQSKNYNYKTDPEYKEFLKSVKEYRKNYKDGIDGLYAYEDPNRSSSTLITKLMSAEKTVQESVDNFVSSLKERKEKEKQAKIAELQGMINSLRKGYKQASLKSDLRDIRINADDETIYNRYFG